MKDPVGTYIKYENIRFGKRQEKILGQLYVITEEYESRGYKLTTRGAYYQMVGRGLTNDWEFKDKRTGKMVVKPNCPEAYNLVKGLLSRGRKAGRISWTAIEDRGRQLYGVNFQTSPASALAAARARYTTDLWHNQPFRPQVWVEKDAQAATVGRVCNELQVDYFPCRGYASDSSLWEAGQRFLRDLGRGQRPIIFHLGDHDPSGIDMTRDNQEKASMFARTEIQVVRIMLNMDQIKRWKLPPNPAKLTDARSGAYVEEHGDFSWELDAAEPDEIERAIREAILKIRDEAAWNRALAERAEDLDQFDRIIEDAT